MMPHSTMRHPRMRPRAGALLGAAVASLVVVSCGSTSSDPEELATFCGSVERYADAADELEVAMDGFELFDDEAQARFDGAGDEFEAALADLAESAPDSVSGDMAAILNHDPETRQVSEQQAYQDALARVNTLVREDCDLDVGL